MIDTDALKRAISIEDVVSSCGIELKKKGTELTACCPFHQENTPSFTVTPHKGNYYCFGCGASGDQIQFLQDLYNEDFKDAATRLARMTGGQVQHNNGSPIQRNSVKREEVPLWIPTAMPSDIPPPKSLRTRLDNDTWTDSPVVAAWAYRDSDGVLHGYTCRVEVRKPDGTTGKDVIPVTWQVNTETGEAKAKQGSLPKPRLLYGTELLDKHPKANIIMVEGEKAADAGRRLLADFPVIVMTWPGGCKAVSHADWNLIKGRKVVGWPDADRQAHRQTGEMLPYCEQPGMKAMLTIADIHGPDFRIVAVPRPGQVTDGWDLADAEAEGWTGTEVMNYLKQHMTTAEQVRATAGAQEPEYHDDEPANDNDEPPPLDEYDGIHGEPEFSGDTAGDEPFRILGWDRARGYYLPTGCRQVTELPSGAHTKLNLLQLAPLRYWREWFPAAKRGDGIDWEMAADSLIRRAQSAGIWDPDLVRGRGAWFDDGRSLVHAGDQVIIDGKPYTLQDAPTRYVYEASKPMKIAMAEPMSNSDSVKFANICEQLRWERTIFGRLLAGWVFLAPICGALDWRPHVWITGGAGSGKSTVLKQIMRPALGETMVFVQGDTSEAGIRQRIRTDALPVVFDEFESEREKAAMRVQDVMALLTQASSDTGASILKGGTGGKADAYKIRSMFAFASIGVNMKQHAARTRVTVLSLKTPSIGYIESQEDVDQYNNMLQQIYDTMTPDYVARLQARAVRMIPTIRRNAIVFGEAAAMSLGTRRMGDQIGTLLAGAYALYSQKEITREQAAKWIQQQDWSDVTDNNDDRDETACINQILAHSIKVETSHEGTKTRTVGELVEKLASIRQDLEISIVNAQDAIARIGMRVEMNVHGHYELWVASAHRELAKILGHTNYSDSWGRVMLRMTGARKLATKKYAGVTSRGVAIPLDSLHEE